MNFTPHNIREGFHALYALARFRRSAEARRLAEASIAAIFEQWQPATGWDGARLERRFGVRLRDMSFVDGLARAVGPLVKFYRATGYGPALRLALVLKEKLLRSSSWRTAATTGRSSAITPIRPPASCLRWRNWRTSRTMRT